MFDDKQAEMIQGKLATDQIDEEADNKDEVREEGADGELPDDMPMEEEKSEDNASEAEKAEEQLERTKAQLKETGTLKPDTAKEQEEKKVDKPQDEEEEKDSDFRDLIDEYDAYLKANAERKMEVDDADSDGEEDNLRNAVSRFQMNLDQFDYMDQKALIRQRFQEWLSDEREHS